MPGLDAARQRRFNQDISGSLIVGTGTGDTTLVTVRNAQNTIYVQKIHIQVTSASATTWNVEDSASTPVALTGDLSVAAAPVDYQIDFGDTGAPCTEGKNLVLDIEAAGAAGIVTWEGYQRQSSNTTIAGS